MKRAILTLLGAMMLAQMLIQMLAQPAAAGPDRFSVLLGSKHIGASGFEEVNPGLFATWEHDKWAVSLGAYRNSYGRGSVAATGHLPLWRWQDGEASVFAGLALYPQDGFRFDTRIVGDVVGIGGLNLRQGPVFVQLLPMVGGGARGLLSFGLTWATGE